MSHFDHLQKARARRGRRRKRRPQMKRMEAYNPRIRRHKWDTVDRWRRHYPERPGFSWGGKLKAPLKKLKNHLWWDDEERN